MSSSSEFNVFEFTARNKELIIALLFCVVIFSASIYMIVDELSEYKSYKIIKVEKHNPSECPKTTYNIRKNRHVITYPDIKYKITFKDDEDKERTIETSYTCMYDNYYKENGDISLNEDYKLRNRDTELIIYSFLAGLSGLVSVVLVAILYNLLFFPPPGST
jgi:hypothetical protein